jgi:RNA polymerase sigma-70 factor, ECF subfamily
MIAPPKSSSCRIPWGMGAMLIVNSIKSAALPADAFAGEDWGRGTPGVHRPIAPTAQFGRSRPPSVHLSILAEVPALRAFAISLCRNVDRADDLVQDTLLRALSRIDSFQPDTNMAAWLFVILRNVYRSEYRKLSREVEDADGRYAETLKTQPEQTSHWQFEELRAALARLSVDQREAIILVGASGYSYEEAAKLCNCAVGTVKSRVNRARIRLAQFLSIESPNDFGPDWATQAM